MSIQAILLPLFVEVRFGLMFGMMYWRGVAATRRRVRHRSPARAELAGARPDQFANALHNQFELPVLFYVLTVLSIITHHADLVFVVLAWIFVIFRVLQAYVHVTNNNVRFRGAYYGVSALVLVAMWIIFMVRILLGLP